MRKCLIGREKHSKLSYVVPDKLTTFGNLNQYAIKPALSEVTALSDFTVTVVPEKTERHVIGILIGWRAKDIEGEKAA